MTAGFIFTALAYAVGALVFYLAARERRAATEGIGYVAAAGLVGGILGAKLTEWSIAHWTSLAAQPAALLDPRLGGRTLIGGLLVGWAAVELAKWRLGIRRSTGDLFALALPAGEAVGRIGCFFNGCCYGVAAAPGWLTVHQHGAWRHPAQLYAAVVALLIFVTLLALRRRVAGEGTLFRVYLVLFGASRFALEFLRERTLAYAGLSLAQWVCLELVLVLLIALALAHRRRWALATGEG